MTERTYDDMTKDHTRLINELLTAEGLTNRQMGVILRRITLVEQEIAAYRKDQKKKTESKSKPNDSRRKLGLIRLVPYF
jgi:hypothetical protein